MEIPSSECIGLLGSVSVGRIAWVHDDAPRILPVTHRIINGQWLDAPNDAEASDQAEELCEEGAPTVELWQAARLVDEIDCAAED